MQLLQVNSVGDRKQSAKSSKAARPAKSLSLLRAERPHQAIPEQAWSPNEYIVGIDEAGRGPVIGPMVYCAFAVQVKDSDLLKATGVNDSKALTPAKRDAIFAKITDPNTPFLNEVDVIGPEEISRTMSSARDGVNLNSLSHNSAISLIRRFLDKSISVKAVYLDTVGSEAKYEQKLRTLFPSIHFVVSQKADAKFICVGAASIVAKVTRDRRIADIEAFYRTPLGSGYPGDPITVKFLKRIVHPFYGFPEKHTRLRWKTCENMIDATGGVVKVSFDEPEKKPFQKQFVRKRTR